MKAQNLSEKDTRREAKKIFYNLKDNISRLTKRDSVLSKGRLIEYEDILSRFPRTQTGKISWAKLKENELRNIYRDLYRMKQSGRFSIRQIESREREYNKYINSIKSKVSADEASEGIDITELENRAYGLLDALYDNIGVVLDKAQRYEYKDRVIEMMYEGKSYRDIITELSDIYNKEYEEYMTKNYEYRSKSDSFNIRDPKQIFDWYDIFGG